MGGELPFYDEDDENESLGSDNEEDWDDFQDVRFVFSAFKNYFF